MGGIHDSILETIGGTPLVRLHRMNDTRAEILVKLESFNPGGSAKDRVGLGMILDAERKGLLKPGATIVEPTSGNTGIGLALAAAVKRYRVVLTMPETMSVERRRLLAAYGADIVLTPGDQGMQGAIDEARRILQETPGAFMPQQFDNEANPESHRRTTAQEILRDTDGRLDALVATVGTGGTLTGIGEVLKKRNPRVEIVAVEPSGSPVLSGGRPGPHRLQGIGAGFVPRVLNTQIIDRIVTVTDEEARTAARTAARTEGLLVGISSGAALHAALAIARRPEAAGTRIVAILPDTGERYLSSWLFQD